MTFDGAIVKEQGITFAIVVVKPHVLNNSHTANEARTSFSQYFPGMPLILMAQNSKGVPTYQGRKDIVKFLANIDHRRIPWKKYSIS
jgi:hypothetical protein